MSVMIDNNLSSRKIREMSIKDLKRLSCEIRNFLLEKVSRTGGHLASNLGVVELTLAIHHVFDLPKDKLIWDVGHQSYVHKIITGRADRFDTLRQTDGLSGFPKRNESVYDTFDSGHSSNSISAACGMAAARDLNGDDYEVIAVIGDGALTGGMAFEALNNAGASDSKMIVILNDNGISISKNIGSITKHLAKLRTSSSYLKFKKKVKNALVKVPVVGNGIYRCMENVRDSVKYAIVNGGVIFEELGFTYLGPVDGHNIKDLTDTLTLAKRMDGPVLIHAITKKGKGYRNAELKPNVYHGVSPFETSTGRPLKASKGHSYSEIFGHKMCELAARDDRIVAISAAMIDGTGLSDFSKRFPDRMFDVGIAEQHAVSFAAGLALSGYTPVVCIYSTFLQRAYDQLMIDVCMQKLPVIFAIDRAGNVGNDGETHNGVFDISYLSGMPGMTVLAPSDGNELRQMMEYAVSLGSPCAIRYPRGNAGAYDPKYSKPFDGKSMLIKKGSLCEIWAVGKMVGIALKASEILEREGISTGVVNVRTVKPLDEDLMLGAPERAEYIITAEDSVLTGGFGSIVSSFLSRKNISIPLLSIGWEDCFTEQGNTDELFERYGLSPEKIAERISDFIERKA